MNYETRNHISPQGIPKVYVTGHKSHFMQYFEHIKNDLLKFSNCAVFYDPDPERPEDIDSFFTLLGSMHLVVLAVTEQFVYEDSFAFSEVFRFANEKHIPVLPILEENGIEADFNQKCGDIQLLNHYPNDPTEIPYEDKLKKFLDSVLIGDEMADKIRSAFDAYVFLSYRKKDRIQAQKLMQLIHSNDFCRDVAIWYDEFLVPGEHFDQAIADAMKKSKLFALAVTPNLLEENNYVMTTEYPEATKANMPIMPVELVKTDNEKLQEKFREIPLPLHIDDTQELERILKQVLALDDPDNNDDPQHLFFIGLAYLYGIDAEIDRERAVKLITAAAEKDLPEAVEKLVGMYHDGEGVKRNYLKAVKWQEYLVALREKQFRQTKKESDAKQWIIDFYRWGHYQDARMDHKEALEIYKNELTALEEVMQLFDSDWCTDHLIRTWLVIGDLHLKSGNICTARSWYEEKLTIAEKIAAQSDPVYVQKYLSFFYQRLGYICEKQHDLVDAMMWYKKAINISEKTAAQSDPVNVQRYLSFLYKNLGDIYEKINDLAGAKAWYEKSLAFAEKLAAQKDPTMDYYLSRFYRSLGSICFKDGDIGNAKTYYEKSIAFVEKNISKRSSFLNKKELSTCYAILGNICQEQGDLANARSWYEKEAAIKEKTVKRSAPNTKNARQKGLSYSYKRLGDICKEQGDLTAAKAWYEKANAIDKKSGA